MEPGNETISCRVEPGNEKISCRVEPGNETISCGVEPGNETISCGVEPGNETISCGVEPKNETYYKHTIPETHGPPGFTEHGPLNRTSHTFWKYPRLISESFTCLKYTKP